MLQASLFFFAPMGRIPFFGRQYNNIIPFFITILGILTLVKAHKRIANFGFLAKFAQKNKFKTSAEVAVKLSAGERLILDELDRRMAAKERKRERKRVSRLTQKSYSSSLLFNSSIVSSPEANAYKGDIVVIEEETSMTSSHIEFATKNGLTQTLIPDISKTFLASETSPPQVYKARLTRMPTDAQRKTNTGFASQRMSRIARLSFGDVSFDVGKRKKIPYSFREISLEGTLRKKKNAKFALVQYKKRYFVVKDGALIKYLDQKDPLPRRQIDLNTITAVHFLVERKNILKFWQPKTIVSKRKFVVKTRIKSYIFFADLEEVAFKWVLSLQQAVEDYKKLNSSMNNNN